MTPHPAATPPTAEQVEELKRLKAQAVHANQVMGADRGSVQDIGWWVMRNWPAVLAALAPAERAEAVPDLLAAAEKIASAPTAEQIEDACIVDDDFEAEITRWLYDTENYRGAEIVKCLQDDLKVLRQAVVAFDMAVRLDAMPAPTRAGALDAAGAKVPK